MTRCVEAVGPCGRGAGMHSATTTIIEQVPVGAVEGWPDFGDPGSGCVEGWGGLG